MPCVGSAWGRAARRLQGWACGRAWFGSGAGGGQTRIGTHACQTRIGEGSCQIRIGNTGGSNPKREKRQQEKNKKIKNKKRRKTCGCNHTGRVATTAVITGLTTTRGYNRSWNCGPRGCGCNQSLNLDRVSGVSLQVVQMYCLSPSGAYSRPSQVRWNHPSHSSQPTIAC